MSIIWPFLQPERRFDLFDAIMKNGVCSPVRSDVLLLYMILYAI